MSWQLMKLNGFPLKIQTRFLNESSIGKSFSLKLHYFTAKPPGPSYFGITFLMWVQRSFNFILPEIFSWWKISHNDEQWIWKYAELRNRISCYLADWLHFIHLIKLLQFQSLDFWQKINSESSVLMKSDGEREKIFGEKQIL